MIILLIGSVILIGFRSESSELIRFENDSFNNVAGDFGRLPAPFYHRNSAPKKLKKM